jgi:hypothetical protein
MTLTDIKRPQAIAVFLYVLSVSSIVRGVGVAGHLVSYDTPTSLRTPASLGCGTPGQKMREGGLALTGAEKGHHTLHAPRGPCAWALSAQGH